MKDFITKYWLPWSNTLPLSQSDVPTSLKYKLIFHVVLVVIYSFFIHEKHAIGKTSDLAAPMSWLEANHCSTSNRHLWY